jgi:esterase/lipase superfamily enzyme
MKKTLYFLLLIPFFILSCENKQKSGSAAPENAQADSTKKADTVQIVKKDSSATKPTISTVKGVKVLYGTDRKVIHLTGKQIAYGEESADINEKYKVGYTIVTIPPIHKPGNIERPSIWKLEFHEDTLKHMTEKVIVPLNDRDFNTLLSKTGKGTDAFIFVHGYNTSFQDAAFRTAQLAFDIHLPIAPIMFSWSSNGKTRSYIRDVENVQVALPAFEDFLKRVAKEGHFKKIHLIAHSMGNRLISEALLALKDDTTNLKIDQIIMAAPDVNASIFKRDYAAAMVKKSKRITVYSAQNDWALKTSNEISGHTRLGQVGLPPFIVDKVDIIDAQNEKTDFLGHDRFARSVVIIKDINTLLLKGTDPMTRHIPFRIINKLPYFYFK